MLWICLSCGTPYAPGVSQCPNCGADEHEDEGAQDMAKITHSGVSDQNAPQPRAGEGDFFQPGEPVADLPEQPAAGANKGEWVAFAELVNEHPGLPSPIDVPADATKTDLIAAYTNITEEPTEGD